MLKRILVILICTVILLCGCQSSTKDNSDTDFDPLLKKSTNIDFGDTTYNIETDSQNYFDVFTRHITASVDGFFLFRWKPKAKILSFVSKDTKEYTPVCSRVDCSHNSDTCDAAFSGLVYINYYDGSLYAVKDEKDKNNPGYVYFNLYKISCDASVYEKEFEMMYAKVNECIAPYYIIHRGYVYYVAESGGDFCLYEYNLQSKDKKLLYRASDEKMLAFIGSMQGYGDGIFFSEVSGENERIKVIYYSQKNGEFYEITDGMTSANFALTGDGIVYYDGNCIKKVSFATLKETTFAESERVTVSYDGRYVYADNYLSCSQDAENADYSNRKINVYDIDGAYIDTISLSGYDCSPIFGDRDYLFFYFNDDNISMLDKSQIGTGKHEWVEVKNF